MSATEQRRKAKRLNVPDLEDDPAERKRVLNVLAQRRYRRRKKEHLQRLEKITHQGFSPSTDSQPTEIVEQVEFSPTQISCFNQFPDQIPLHTWSDDEPFPTGVSNASHDLLDSFAFDSATLEAFDASLEFPLPSLPTTPSLTTATPSSQNAMTHTPRSQSTNFDRNFGFADEACLPSLELNLLRATMSIAKRLEVDSLIWSMESNSPFHNSMASAHTHLPVHLRPTEVQLRNPHHPVFDILPWPGVRDRLILVFAQPEEIRPPSARGPIALMTFAYDFEDSAEGIRVSGDDPFSGENWEVGEKLFKNWWWALDRRVIHRSNQLRRERGARLLGAERQIEEVQ